MLNGRQRAYLRSIANTLKPITQIGKDCIVTEAFLDQLDAMLDSREIVKVTILETAGLDAKETANAICKALEQNLFKLQVLNLLYTENQEDPKIFFPGQNTY